MSKIVLFGCGRGADVAFRLLTGDTSHEVIAFTVDGAHLDRREKRGLPVVAFEEVERHYPPEDIRMLILLGYQEMNGLRKRKFDAAKAMGYTLESYVASDIFRVEPIRTGENCIIMDNQSISLDVEIGDNVVLWSSNHIGDMSVVGDHAWISSHVTIAANVTVGMQAFVGIGATIGNGVSIGAESFIGAEVLASSDTHAGSVHVYGKGNVDLPARAFMRSMIAMNKL